MFSLLNPLNYFYGTTSISADTSTKEAWEKLNGGSQTEEHWVVFNHGQVITIIEDYDPRMKLALNLQPIVRGWLVRKEMVKVKALKMELSRIEIVYNQRIEELKKSILEVESEKNELELQRKKIGTDFKELGYKVKVFFSEKTSKEESSPDNATSLSPKEELDVAITERLSRIEEMQKQSSGIMKEKEHVCQDIQEKIEEAVYKMLGKKKGKTEAGAIEAGLTSNSVPEPSRQETDPYNKMLEDIGAHTHDELKNLLKVLFGKVKGDIVKKWTFDARDDYGEFSMALDHTIKLWVRPKLDDNKYDSRTPKGIVLVIGGSEQNVVKGTIHKKHQSITFDSGFEVFCRYTHNIWIKTIEGLADGRIDCIQYEESKGEVAIRTTSTARNFKMSMTNTENSKISTLRESWKVGTIISGCHEEFLERQESITV